VAAVVPLLRPQNRVCQRMEPLRQTLPLNSQRAPSGAHRKECIMTVTRKHIRHLINDLWFKYNRGKLDVQTLGRILAVLDMPIPKEMKGGE
jgi:hypothetical protein